MSAVDPGEAQWLQSDGSWAGAADATAVAWGKDAVETRIYSALALEADAAAQAAAQLAWLKGPTVVDVHQVPGQRFDLYLRWIRITIDRLGYDAGVDAFVIDVAEGDAGTTQLVVLRPL